MSVYKKLTTQDINISPFYVNKQYNFTSASAAASSVGFFSSSWTSESIYSYSSGAEGGSSSLDTLNTIKYNQLDHLFYKNFKRDVATKMGSIKNYRLHRRDIYKELYTVSIPSGLTGNQIKPNTFYLSSSTHEIIDDGFSHLILSGSDLDVSYSMDVRSNIFSLGPQLGFRKYDLSIINDSHEAGLYYRRGKKLMPDQIPNKYNTPDFGDQYDDSHYFNLIKYKNVNFSECTLNGGKFSSIDFGNLSSTVSSVQMYHNERFDFNPEDDFTISFWVKVKTLGITGTQNLIQKSKLETIIPTPNEKRDGVIKTNVTGALQFQDISAGPIYPFKIYISESLDSAGGGGQGACLFFERSDGTNTPQVFRYLDSTPSSTGSMQHITCRKSASIMTLYINGVQHATTTDNTVIKTQNNANIYVGGSSTTGDPVDSTAFTGSISQINIYNKSLTATQILNHYSSSNSSPYIGNIFYSNGLAVVTHPNYKSLDTINTLKFQNTYQIFENEYLCTIDEHEFGSTLNTSARRLKSSDSQYLANFTTGSKFQPYVTTIGLYNEDQELLVVGKLGQPIRMSGNTDTTFAIRWDT